MAITSRKFLPKKYGNYPFYDKIVIPLLDHVLELHEERFAYISEKYTNYTNIDEQVAKDLISELGFDYILDGLTLNASDARIILGYLKLFRLLKDSNDGLKLVVDLLGYNYKTHEWFEDIANNSKFTRAQLMGLAPINIASDPFTYIIEVTFDLLSLDLTKLRKFKKFSRNYVYSVLKLVIDIAFDLAELNIAMAGFIDQEYTSSGELGLLYTALGGFIDQEYRLVPTDTLLLQNTFDQNLLDLSGHNFTTLLSYEDSVLINQFNLNTNDFSDYSLITNIINEIADPLILKNQFTNNVNDASGQGLTTNIISEYVEPLVLDNNFNSNINDSSINALTSNITAEILDLGIDSNTLWYLRCNNDSNDYSGNSNNGIIVGTTNFISPLITNDTSEIRLDGSTYIQSTNFDTTNFTELTLRAAILFETGDISAKTNHSILSKYNTNLGYPSAGVFSLTYDSVNKQTSVFIADSTSTSGNEKYVEYKIDFEFQENVIYLIQASFKLVDPSHSNLNYMEISINGIPYLVSILYTGLSNLSNLFTTSVKFYAGAEINVAGVPITGQFNLLRLAIDSKFRTCGQALYDIYNITR